MQSSINTFDKTIIDYGDNSTKGFTEETSTSKDVSIRNYPGYESDTVKKLETNLRRA